MKQIFIFFILFLTLLSCNREKQISKQIMAEWISFYDNENIDLTNELNAFEASLIKEGYLKCTTSESYKNLYRSLSEETHPKIDLPANVSLACVRINKKTKTPLLTQIKFFSELEELIGQTKFDQSGLKEYPFLGVSDLITNETISNDVVKSYILMNLMVLAVDLSSELKNILPKSNVNTEGLEVVKLINAREILFSEKSYSIEEFETFLCKSGSEIENLSLIVSENLAMKEIVKFMNLCIKQKIKLKLSKEKIKN